MIDVPVVWLFMRFPGTHISSWFSQAMMIEMLGIRLMENLVMLIMQRTPTVKVEREFTKKR